MKPVETALDVALIVMQNGGSTSKAEQTFQNILTGYKQDGISTIWRLDFVAANSIAEEKSPVVLRAIGSIGVNLLRVSKAVMLGEKTAKGTINISDIASEIERIKAVAPPYNRWMVIAAAGCAGGAYSQMWGGDWGALYISFAAAVAGQFFRSLLQAGKLTITSVTLICGVLSACIAAFGLRLNLSQTTVVALISSVIYLAPGLPLINGFVDMMSHKHMSVGLERIAGAIFLFLILSVSIAFAYIVFIQ